MEPSNAGNERAPKKLTVSFSDQVREQLEELAARQGPSLTEAIRAALSLTRTDDLILFEGHGSYGDLENILSLKDGTYLSVDDLLRSMPNVGVLRERLSPNVQMVEEQLAQASAREPRGLDRAWEGWNSLTTSDNVAYVLLAWIALAAVQWMIDPGVTPTERLIDDLDSVRSNLLAAVIAAIVVSRRPRND